jgi:hypothetical protein
MSRVQEAHLRAFKCFTIHRWKYIPPNAPDLLTERSTDNRSELSAVMRMKCLAARAEQQ